MTSLNKYRLFGSEWTFLDMNKHVLALNIWYINTKGLVHLDNNEETT